MKYFIVEELLASGEECQSGLYLVEGVSEEAVRLSWKKRYGLNTLWDETETRDGNIYSLENVYEVPNDEAIVLKKHLPDFHVDNSLKGCDECHNIFSDDQGSFYKYEPSRWMCDDCLAENMDDVQS
jgi:hypothetical protein